MTFFLEFSVGCILEAAVIGSNLDINKTSLSVKSSYLIYRKN